MHHTDGSNLADGPAVIPAGVLDYRGKIHEPLPSEVFIGCCALCGADLGHWWHGGIEDGANHD